MSKAVHHILIVTKAESSSLPEQAKAIAELATRQNISAAIQENRLDNFQLDTRETRPDMVLVLGGDGTMLSVARKLPDKNIPLLGINFGRVGFLTEIQPDDWQQELPKVFSGQYDISPRIVFSFAVRREGHILKQGTFFNDLVLNRGPLARLIHLRIQHGEHNIGTVKADALIVSTPSGSSSYCVSAGGPLVCPELRALVLCPVSPFLHGFYPMVLPPDRELTIRVEEKRTETALTLDGQIGFALRQNDEIHIQQARHDLLFVQGPNHLAWFQKLATKGFVSS